VVASLFDDDGHLTDEPTRRGLVRLLAVAGFIRWTERRNEGTLG
jgi:hypothetical protein